LMDGYGLSLNLANTSLTAMFLGSAVLGLVGGELSDRFSASLILVVSYLLLVAITASVATLLLAPAVAVVAVVLAGGSTSIGGPARSKLVDTLSMRGDLGKNFAIITVGTSVGGSVAPPVFGTVIEVAGLRSTFLAVAAVGLVAIAIVVAIIYQYRDRVDARFAVRSDD